ncbi:hypothetical protein LWI29_010762 [Acer saccharum]|uniref:Uncharacterized protein n=1 Tax=Acer saccharum TaxID=4024 RepID=A0AA39S6N5_ACESA|nr:hypothetical protein LWI29_010762 [Acer saccharum]
MYICTGCHLMFPNINSLLEHRLGCEKSDDDDFTMILNTIFYSDDNDKDIVLQAELSVQFVIPWLGCDEAGDDLTDFINSVLYDDSNDKGQWDDDIEVMDWDLKIMLSLPEEVLQADMEEIAMHHEDLLIYVNDDQFIEVEWGMVQLEDLEEEDVEAAIQPTIGVVQLDNLKGCDEAGNDLTAFLNFVLYNDSDDEGQWDDDIEVLDSNLEVMLSLPKELLQA